MGFEWTDLLRALILHVKYAAPRRGPSNVGHGEKRGAEWGTKLAAFKIKTLFFDLCEVSCSLSVEEI